MMRLFLIALVLVGAPLGASAEIGASCDPSAVSEPNGCDAGEHCVSVNGQPAECISDAMWQATFGTTLDVLQGGGVGGDAQGGSQGRLTNPLKANTLEGLLVLVMEGVRNVSLIFLVLALVFTGVLFVFAQGNEEKLKTARQALFWTVVGGILVLSFQVILEVLKRTVENISS